MDKEDFEEAGPSALLQCEMNMEEEEEDDEDMEGGHSVLDFMETTMETNDEEGSEDEEGDYDDNLVEVEPEIYLDSPADYEDEDSILEEGFCQVCRGPLSSHANGEPCDVGQFSNFGGDHFLNNDSNSFDAFNNENSNSSSVTNGSSGRSSARKTNIGSKCPVCEQTLHKQHARDHIAWHFMDELRAMISDPTQCPQAGCDYKSEKLENTARHLALFHSKLDEFMSDPVLMEEKKQKALTKPKKISVGTTCLICGLKEPAREHVSRHFMKELMELVACLPDQIHCPHCQYKGEKPQNLARHIALVHNKLDELLQDQGLVNERKAEFMSRPNKLTIGPNCPVCNQALSKQHSRVHVIWHYMDDLRAMVSTFRDPLSCELCDYTNVSSDKIAKHLALFHSKLDELLQDENLLAEKRAKAMSKPKRESIGPSCPICDTRDPPREHVARHFGEELNAYVSTNLPDQFNCPECPYKGEKTKNLELHIALVHGKLDEFLKDQVLVNEKRLKFMATPKKQVIGPKCPICDMKFTKSQNRDHVSWHFMEELREYVQTFPNPQNCLFCSYTSEKIDNLVKHLALGHSKLDELLQNKELVANKRAKVMSKPKKIAIGPTCPVCDVKEPAREHVARHFGEELMQYINNLPNQTQCNECEYKGDKPKTLAIHVSLVHGKLDIILANKDLVALKRAKFMAKPKKQSIGPVCPVCDIQFTKNQNRDHVAWHYMDELRAIVQQFPDPAQCTQCPYNSDSMEKMVKHVALGHSMLDGFLQDEELLHMKRIKALSKPKKVSIGPTCPICDIKDPPREHVARHFGDELLEIVDSFPDQSQCTDCIYKNDKPKNVAIHIALVHNILDQILTNEELVACKREKFISKPQKVNLGNKCPVCDQPFTKGQNRDHVCWHFMDELREIVMNFPDREACPDCSYTSDKLDNLVKHVALGHSKLDELLQNEELVAQKREIFMSKPKKINIGPKCPICDIKFSKGQNRDHVSWHFMDELREFVKASGYEKACTLCYYTTDKLDNLVKHYALGHSKLDELLQDEALIQQKREIVKKKPKRLSFGKDCPICGQTGRDRDHVARHFMPELMELVNVLPKTSRCDKCEYSNSRKDYMAKHIALFHCKLDEFMQDTELVAAKRESAKAQPKKMSMGENCLICGVSMPNREHVVRHFMPELNAIIAEKTDNPLSCPECSFTAERAEYVARHLGLVHCKLDEFLMDGEMVAKKVKDFQGVIEINSGNKSGTVQMKTLPMREAVRKSRRQQELEERQAIEMREKKEREERERQERIEMEREKKRKREEEAAAVLAKETTTSHSPSPAKMPKLEFQRGSSLMEITRKALPQPESLLKATLLQPKTPSPNKKKEGGLQITIKRTTPAKWQIKSKGSPKPVTASITPINRNNPNPDNPGAEMHVSEPDISHLLMPEITHEMGGDESEEEEEEDNFDHMNSMLNPEVILDTPAVEDEFCDVCGVEFVRHDQPCNPVDMENDATRPLAYNACPVCDAEVPSREHITKHFLEELIEVTEAFTDPLTCPQCQYKTEKNSSVAMHISIAHAQLEKCLQDKVLVTAKRNENFAQSLNAAPRTPSSTQRTSSSGTPIISVSCPICDQMLNKSHSRDHIVWHFMEELRSALPPADNGNYNCPQCNYKGEKSDNTARHLALFHGQLDLFLTNQPLVLMKRQKCLSKPKKAHIGANCPVCDFKDPPREHVSRHFMPELLEHVATLPDQLGCAECNYRGEKPQNLAKHIALVHSMLDELLRMDDLVAEKRRENMAKPKKVSIGDHCPVCELAIPKRDSRVHVIWHFMDDLREMVANFADQRICDLCGYQNMRPDKMAKHIGLGHSKLDELLMNEELIQMKKEIAVNKPKKLVLGPQCPICGIQFSKNQNRDHVAWHFMDELREMVLSLQDPRLCPQCPYTSEKIDNLVKHIALGHSKLDELMQDEELVASKKAKAQLKTKKVTIGGVCPICDTQFTKAQNRDHVSWHFVEELREIVQSFPDPQSCVMCEYTSEKVDNLVKHLSLGHSKLDEFLQDEELVAQKRLKFLNKPKKFQLGPTCPICDMNNPQRDHVVRHFMEELSEYVESKLTEDKNQLVCDECGFRGEKMENLAKHAGLFHCKLDELLYDSDFVAAKKNAYKAKLLEQTSEVQCQVCNRSLLRQRLREHCYKHFSDEVRAIIATFKKPTVCMLCKENGGYYKSEKKEAMVKHVALSHGKMDEYLLDPDMLARKRNEFANIDPADESNTSLSNMSTDVSFKVEPKLETPKVETKVKVEPKSPLRSPTRVSKRKLEQLKSEEITFKEEKI